MKHSELLLDTKIWQIYADKLGKNSERLAWVKTVYENARNQLNYVPRIFPNFTLHDERHILNVLDAMAGLLGDQIIYLTVGEAELLILAACLHDIGMVYTDDDIKKCFNNKHKCRDFLNKYHPELIDVDSKDWGELVQQNYLRWLHPIRVSEVLRQDMWKELFKYRPKDIVPKEIIIAVCQAHGEDTEIIKGKAIDKNGKLRYMKARDEGCDPLFCTILLRLGDILDFDDTRAPYILYNYTQNSAKSREELEKHIASGGFNYELSPSEGELSYYAECTNPNIERAIRSYLDWIDEELANSRNMKRQCCERWINFPFPYKINRDEISREGYDYGDFKLTIAQEQLIKLLVGENIYDSNDVFIRELLQNAIDATLLRGEMNPDFDVKSELARIDLWEWRDSKGNYWFRIDDRGIGMTKGMIERYFLQVGNSYYKSDELMHDLRDNGYQHTYMGTSRFGIGFLSCFLCATSAQISTLYFDEKKSKREEGDADGYGIRMNITGLTGYYVLQNQAIENNVSEYPMPSPDFFDMPESLENNNYRSSAGTSIAICIDLGKLNTINLKEAAEKFICGTSMPIYYNGKRIGQTYKEVMEEGHRFLGRQEYKLSFKEKEQFDLVFPNVARNYPQIIITSIPLDSEKYHVLDGLSGVLIKYEIYFKEQPIWSSDDCNYEVSATINTNRKGQVFIKFCMKEQFPKLSESWIWTYRSFNIFIDENRGPSIKFIRTSQYDSINIYYNGIFCGQLDSYENYEREMFIPIIFLEKNWCPNTDIGRNKIRSLQLDVLLSIFAIISYSGCCCSCRGFKYAEDWRLLPLSEWRKVDSRLTEWINKIYTEKKFPELFLLLYEHHKEEIEDISSDMILNTYFAAHFQDMYKMTFSYDEKTLEQKIKLCGKVVEDHFNAFSFFPPLMFCHAADEVSRRYLCSDTMFTRNCINLDHPFTIWLLKNAEYLVSKFNRQFRQIVEILRYGNEFENDEIIDIVNSIKKQLMYLSNSQEIDITTFPELTKNDFYYTEV